MLAERLLIAVVAVLVVAALAGLIQFAIGRNGAPAPEAVSFSSGIKPGAPLGDGWAFPLS